MASTGAADTCTVAGRRRQLLLRRRELLLLGRCKLLLLLGTALLPLLKLLPVYRGQRGGASNAGRLLRVQPALSRGGCCCNQAARRLESRPYRQQPGATCAGPAGRQGGGRPRSGPHLEALGGSAGRGLRCRSLLQRVEHAVNLLQIFPAVVTLAGAEPQAPLGQPGLAC